MQETVSIGEFLSAPLILLGIVFIFAFIISGYPKKKIMGTIASKLPSPLERVKYVKMIYIASNGEKYCPIEKAVCTYSGQPDIASLRYQYSIFIDSSLFVDKNMTKSFILLDENKKKLPTPQGYTVKYYEHPESGCGFITFQK